MRVRSKVSFLFLGVLFFSCCTLIFIGYRHYYATLKNQIFVQQNDLCQSIMGNIDRFLYERLVDTRNLSLYSEMNEDDFQSDKIQRVLNSYNRENVNYQSISFFDHERIRIADTKNSSIGSKHTLSKYWKGLEKSDYALDVSKSESLKEVVIHFASKVFNPLGQQKGTIVTRLKIEELYQVISSVFQLRNISSLARVELVDQNGKLLYSSHNPEGVLKTIPEYYEQLRKIEKGKGCEFGDFLLFTNEEQGYANFEGNHWHLVMLVDKQMAFAPLMDLNNQFKLALVAIFVFSTIISFLLSHHLTNPIGKLVSLADDFANGRLNSKVNIKQKDEIGMLGYTLQSMARRLETRLEDYRKLNSNLTEKCEMISAQKNEIEEKNEQINSSIRYAQKIQQTLLESNSLPDNGVNIGLFYKPLDQVSGDFYYAKRIEVSGRAIYVTVVGDCTGHGVPGAFLTIMALNFLDEILGSGIYSPNKIIAELHIKMSNVLKNNNHFIMDSIDLAVLTYDTIENYVVFAGANRPLIIKNGAAIKKIKGSKFSVGDEMFRRVDFCENHCIEISSNQTFYLFSDGIVDQFNSATNRKLTTRKLLEFLNRQEGFASAKDVEYYVSKWMGDSTFQTDDMVFLSIDFDYESCLMKNTPSKNIALGRFLGDKIFDGCCLN